MRREYLCIYPGLLYREIEALTTIKYRITGSGQVRE
jgi:hypothetical protein